MLSGYVALTDFSWYEFLRGRYRSEGIDEVNFWKPSGQPFKAIAAGEPVLFKLKAPRNAIGGWGLSARAAVLPDWLAWDAFGFGNGTADRDTLLSKLRSYRQKNGMKPSELAQVTCIAVTNPVFFDDQDWVRAPSDWSTSIVSGKTYDLERGEGQRIWRECLDRAQGPASASAIGVNDREGRYAAPRLVKQRLGQGTFKMTLVDAYERACAVTNEHSLPVLEAAHIVPYAKGGEHSTRNGMLLRRDLHTLFDMGYLTVSPEYRLELSPRLRQDYGNGRLYESYHGNPITVPKNPKDRPDPQLLDWHGKTIFLRAS
jgi:putative restriction endonuclease